MGAARASVSCTRRTCEGPLAVRQQRSDGAAVVCSGEGSFVVRRRCPVGAAVVCGDEQGGRRAMGAARESVLCTRRTCENPLAVR
jgi:hypothetical protein